MHCLRLPFVFSSSAFFNVVAVERLQNWLLEWKCQLIQDKDDVPPPPPKIAAPSLRRKSGSSRFADSGDFVGDDDDEEEEDYYRRHRHRRLGNATLICGPPGVLCLLPVKACLCVCVRAQRQN